MYLICCFSNININIHIYIYTDNINNISLIMINKVVIISKYLPYKSLYTFSITNATDPYYILGVEKTA